MGAVKGDSAKDHLISQFIDDELDLDEKTNFLGWVAGQPAAVRKTVELIEQEKLLRINFSAPIQIQPMGVRWRSIWQTGLKLAAGAVTAAFLFLMVWPQPQTSPAALRRFVIYQPEVRKTTIVGSFTDWKPIPLQPAGHNGYWEIRLPLPNGVHRYSFIVDGHRQIPDPTILTREADDFGGQNTVITIGEGI